MIITAVCEKIYVKHNLLFDNISADILSKRIESSLRRLSFKKAAKNNYYRAAILS